ARPCQGRGGRFEPGLPLQKRSRPSRRDFLFWVVLPNAPVVKLVDTPDLKSCSPQGECRFDSGPGHNALIDSGQGVFFSGFIFRSSLPITTSLTWSFSITSMEPFLPRMHL